MKHWEDLFIELEGKRITIALLSNDWFECIVSEAECDFVKVFMKKNEAQKDFEVARYVAYNAIAYVYES